MLGWFPELYPDELLASACARYADRLEYPTQHTAVRELFGAGCSRVAYDVPGHLNHLVGQLPSQGSYSPQEILYKHTLFPFYVSLHSVTRVAQLERQIGEAPSNVIYKAVGMIRYRQRCPPFLRFCPECASEDETRYGEPYWRRNHQLPGVEVCTKHGRCILSTRIALNGSSLIRAKHVIRLSQLAADSAFGADAFLEGLANDARRMLEDKLHLSPSFLGYEYRSQLKQRGLLRNGRILTTEAADSFIKSVPPAVLELLSFDIRKDRVGSWIKQLAAGRIYHPLDHLIMMRFLQIPMR